MLCIVLLGPKHSGKTSAGEALALLLPSCRFVDLDAHIEQQNGKSPRSLYHEGPEIFKKAETEALEAAFQLQETHDFSSLVIASGGGLIDNPDALAILRKNAAARTVFLDIPAQTAWERITEEEELPPFLNTENPRKTHRCLHECRTDSYRQLAFYTIKAEGKAPQEIAREILHNLNLNSGRRESNPRHELGKLG